MTKNWLEQLKSGQALQSITQLVCGLGILVALFKFGLGASFGLDETISAWVTDASLQQSWQRALSYQGQSPLYFALLWCWRSLSGDSEWALRLPSFLDIFADPCGANICTFGTAHGSGLRIFGFTCFIFF
jgi:hypothetical protein